MNTDLLSRTEPVAPVTTTTETPARRSTPWWWVAGLAACVLLAAVLRFWGAAAHSGVGNSYYAAAALSMSRDWGAFFTGGLDTETFVSIDKPAPWLWPSALLIKVFGVSWASMFLPSVLAGIASVLLVGLAVREGFGDRPGARAAGLLAAAGLAISPMNIVVDRNNAPDAIMLMWLLAAAWMTMRAVRRGRMLPLAMAGALAGLAFNAKYVQAYIVVPAMVAAWLIAAGLPFVRRLAGLGAMAVGGLVTSVAWPLAFALMPAGQRPWIAGTTDGSMLARLTGIVDVHVAPPTFPGNSQFALVNAFLTGEVFHAGPAGKSRLLTGVLADQISWWLPMAVFAGLIMAITPRPDGRRGAGGLVLWSGWALACWLVFSFMGGVLHPYYTSMMMPAIAALAASGLVTSWTLWRQGSLFGAATLATQIALVTGWSAWVLLSTRAIHPDWLAPLVITTGALAVAVLLVLRSRASAAVAALTAVAALAAPAVWAVRSLDQPLLGGNPLANQEGRYRPAVLPEPMAEGFMNQLEPKFDPGLVPYLQQNRGGTRWMAATLTALMAAPLIVASGGEPVMAIGGYDGRDPLPTPDEFREHVRNGDVRFVLAPPEGNGTNSFLQGPAVDTITWARSACRPVTEPGVNHPAGPVLLDCAPAS
ncbi:glycosyltransferase family 39 protein [Actinoplanes sp. NPDC051861]|uniref:ArnT family glycosyltransferase n=1 Tax=Actinoplanes sp. NPDC051861 TaxID=3155170 RepID=UPI003430EA09